MIIIGGDVQDWLNACRTTITKLKADPKAEVTGGSTLKDLLDRGDDVVVRLDRWLGKGKRAEQRTVRFTTADTITPKPVHWVWDTRILAGRPRGGRPGWTPPGRVAGDRSEHAWRVGDESRS